MPNLAPISENGRPISSVCSFCGRVAAGIRPLDCRSHFICDSCSQQRRIYSVCPLCASRDRHSVMNPNNKYPMISPRPRVLHPAEYHTEPSPSSSLFPSLPPVQAPSTASVQPNFGVPAVTTQALPVYCLHAQESGEHVFPTCSESVFPDCPSSFSTYHPESVDSYGFSKPPPIPDYGEVVPNPYIQQEINRSMIPLNVNSDPYEQPKVYQMMGTNNSPAVPITHSSSLPQYIPPPQSQSVPQIVPESGMGKVIRSVSRAFTRLNRKLSKSSSTESPPYPYSNPPVPSPHYTNYPIGPISPMQPNPPPFSAYPPPANPQWPQQAPPQYPAPVAPAANPLVLRRQNNATLDENALRQFWASSK